MKVISLLLVLVSCATTIQEDKELPLKRKLRQCYVESDSYTGMRGQVQGKMMVSIVVEPSEKVKSAEIVQSDFKDPNLLACVRGVIKTTPVENKTGKDLALTMPVTFEEVRR